jgi:hypothetical protein
MPSKYAKEFWYTLRLEQKIEKKKTEKMFEELRKSKR